MQAGSLFEHPTKFFNGYSNWLDHKFRPVIAQQAENVLFGIFLRQHECLFNFSIIEIGKICTAIVAIAPSTRQHNPMSVARPRRVAVGKTFAVQVGKIKGRWILLVERNTNSIGITVPDMETTILPLGKEQIAPVGANSWQGGTLVLRGCVIYEFLIAKAVRCLVERTPV